MFTWETIIYNWRQTFCWYDLHTIVASLKAGKYCLREKLSYTWEIINLWNDLRNIFASFQALRAHIIYSMYSVYGVYTWYDLHTIFASLQALRAWRILMSERSLKNTPSALLFSVSSRRSLVGNRRKVLCTFETIIYMENHEYLLLSVSSRRSLVGNRRKVLLLLSFTQEYNIYMENHEYLLLSVSSRRSLVRSSRIVALHPRTKVDNTLATH